MRVWKWTLNPTTGEQIVEMPMNAKILSLQLQYGMPQIWALVDERETRKQSRRIGMYHTGKPIPDSPGEFINTLQMNDGETVLHVFER